MTRRAKQTHDGIVVTCTAWICASTQPKSVSIDMDTLFYGGTFEGAPRRYSDGVIPRERIGLSVKPPARAETGFVNGRSDATLPGKTFSDPFAADSVRIRFRIKPVSSLKIR